MTSGGKQKPAKADGALGTGSGRRVLMLAVCWPGRTHRRCNSAHRRLMSRVRRSQHVDDRSIAVDDKYLIVIVVLTLLFGTSGLPSLTRNLSEKIHEFKRSIAEDAR